MDFVYILTTYLSGLVYHTSTHSASSSGRLFRAEEREIWELAVVVGSMLCTRTALTSNQLSHSVNVKPETATPQFS